MVKLGGLLSSGSSDDTTFRDLAPTLGKLSKVKLDIPLITSTPFMLDGSDVTGIVDTIGMDAATSAVQAAENGAPSVTIPDSDIKGTPLERAIVNGAQQFLGVPYVWGGEDPSGFDCSGLVQYVYQNVGINVPRVTYQQFEAGTKIDPNKARPGDLVFFRMEDQGPGHVGIYAGNGKYIAAPQTGEYVSIKNLADRKDLVGVRRFR